ncbi:MAG: tyrosine--tRNA ligase [bacterium]
MTTGEKLELLKSVGEEIITENELKDLLSSDEKLISYDGFEPSGQMHIGQGILRTININKLIKAGIKFKMLVADWHAFANKKMCGDLEKIKTVGKYFIEVWKAAGLDMENVEFVWASDLVKDTDYWKLVLQIATTNSLRRFIRTAEIMGREESLDLSAAQIIYSCMQTADIFTLGAKITQLGSDQRKINVLAREIGPQLGFWKPVIISHHMILGLGKPPESKDTIKKVAKLKMSKSKPDSAIFMTDTKTEVEEKISKAWCPIGETEQNPILEYFKYIVFEKFDEISIKRSEKFGGEISISSFNKLKEQYEEKKIHPEDLKITLSSYINEILDPIRIHFEKNPYAKSLLKEVKSFKVTR